MARRKSVNDIMAQNSRIQRMVEENGLRNTGGYGSQTYSRLSNQANNIANRYINNIMSHQAQTGNFSANRRYGQGTYRQGAANGLING